MKNLHITHKETEEFTKLLKKFNPDAMPNNTKYMILRSTRKELEAQLSQVLKNIKVSNKRLIDYKRAIFNVVSTEFIYLYTNDDKEISKLKAERDNLSLTWYFIFKRLKRRNGGLGVDILKNLERNLVNEKYELISLLLDFYINNKE